MLTLHSFYRKFEELPRDERFKLIEFQKQPTSFFVIFQQLSEVRKQIKYFEDREEHLLKQAEEAFKKRKQ
jgi:hypothetical protein